jgi:nucleoid DNA-binding protein
MPLTKTQLARLIAADTGLSQKKSAKILNVLIDIIKHALARGDSVQIRGFGKFYLKYQKKRTIKHPSTGDNLIIGQKNIAKFRSFKVLHKEINYYDFDITKFFKENEEILKQLFDLIEYCGDYEEQDEEKEEIWYKAAIERRNKSPKTSFIAKLLNMTN